MHANPAVHGFKACSFTRMGDGDPAALTFPGEGVGSLDGGNEWDNSGKLM